MKKPIICVALGVLCALGSSFAVRAAAQDPSTSAAQTEASPEVKRVLDTYAEIMQEVLEQMAAGGRQTERMAALERRMAEEVKTALPELFEVVRNGDFESANAAAYALHSAPDPHAAVTPLLAGLHRFDGKMANNVFVALMYLCIEHPAVEVPVEPLVRALRVREWSHQHKASQVIEVLAQRGGVKDPDGALAGALIPMLASQRMRVFRPAREILPKVTGQSLGNAPEPWGEVACENLWPSHGRLGGWCVRTSADHSPRNAERYRDLPARGKDLWDVQRPPRAAKDGCRDSARFGPEVRRRHAGSGRRLPSGAINKTGRGRFQPAPVQSGRLSGERRIRSLLRRAAKPAALLEAIATESVGRYVQDTRRVKNTHEYF